MTLRKANHADASSIAAISIEVWVGTYLKKGVTSVFADYALSQFTTQNMQTLIEDPSQYILVSQNEEGIDGFIRLSANSPDPVTGGADMEIATFYVQPRHHGKGIGKRLLSAAFAHCRDAGAQALWLATNAENAPAIAFYRAQGFRQIGETSFCLDGKAYLNAVYQRDLSPTSTQ